MDYLKNKKQDSQKIFSDFIDEDKESSKTRRWDGI